METVTIELTAEEILTVLSAMNYMADAGGSGGMVTVMHEGKLTSWATHPNTVSAADKLIAAHQRRAG